MCACHRDSVVETGSSRLLLWSRHLILQMRRLRLTEIKSLCEFLDFVSIQLELDSELLFTCLLELIHVFASQFKKIFLIEYL